MSAIYNEIDPYAAQWTRNLIAAGHVAPGVVDERSIVDLRPDDVSGHGQRHFFAGIAVWSYALRLAGVSDDSNIWTGSCPCQGLSDAGRKLGFADPRHLWPAWFRLIRECRPRVVLGEQVASRLGLEWLDLVCADLEGAGYTVRAADTCAAGFGAPHIRQRLYFVAYANGAGQQDRRPGLAALDSGAARGLADADIIDALDRDESRGGGLLQSAQNAAASFWRDAAWIHCSDGRSRPVEPGTCPLAHGVAARVGRLRATGNAIVSRQALAFIAANLDVITPAEAS